MASLQEVLSVLLGAESEANQIVEDARSQSAGVIQLTHDSFEPRRKSKLAATREQAASLIDNASAAVGSETKQITDRAAAEREAMERRYGEAVGSVVEALVSETVEKILIEG